MPRLPTPSYSELFSNHFRSLSSDPDHSSNANHDTTSTAMHTKKAPCTMAASYRWCGALACVLSTLPSCLLAMAAIRIRSRAETPAHDQGSISSQQPENTVYWCGRTESPSAAATSTTPT